MTNNGPGPPAAAIALDYPAMLDELHTRLADGPVAAPTGYAIASPRLLPDAVPTAANRLGLACCRPGGGGPGSAAPPEDLAGRFADGLLALHRTVLRDVLDHAMRQLDQRTSEGTSLLARPELQADLADAAIDIRESEVPLPGGPTGPRARWACHQRLTRAGRTLARLLGGSSMLADGPGATIYLTEFVGNVYLHPGGGD